MLQQPFGNNAWKMWQPFFQIEKKKKYFQALIENVKTAYQTKVCCPLKEDIFHVFKLVLPEQVKVIILGQDPYHTVGVADGIAFSCKDSYRGKTPPSLQNIMRELKNDCGIWRSHRSLASWVRQGVLLINTVWTVEAHLPNSHFNFGWQEFTYNLIDYLVTHHQVVILVLWGKQAQKFGNNFRSVLQIKSGHPSPFSYHLFQNTKPFSQINKILNRKHLKTINWEI